MPFWSRIMCVWLDGIAGVGMLLKPISASEALYARALEQIFFRDPGELAQLLAIDSCGTFEGKSLSALALTITIEVGRYCNRSFTLLALQFWLYQCI